MRNIYKISLTVFVLFFTTNTMLAQGFAKKKDLEITRIRKKWDDVKKIKFSDFFDYPDDIGLKDNLENNTEITITFSSTNENIIKFDSYYHSQWSGQYFKYKIPKDNYGSGVLTITVSYKGIDAVSQISVNLIPIICKNDKYDLNIGDTLEVDVLKNDAPSYKLNKTTFEIMHNIQHGIFSSIQEGELTYVNNNKTPNYTTDSLIYRVADQEGNYDTATVYFNIHRNPYVSKIFEFLPAPGQFVNGSFADTNLVQNKKMIGKNGRILSLGGLGGYVIVGFDQPIVDRPENPYGVDFTVKGNAFIAHLGGYWSEPGAVQVMKDENRNGIPDDTWYELAGSDYYLETTEKNATITYYNPKYNRRATIYYRLNNGEEYAMRTNSFHNQPYYPDPYAFGINKDSISYPINKIHYLLDKSNPGYIECMKRCVFGYVDNYPNNNDLTSPKNPYYADENGSAADGFDLKWAVDNNGNRVQLDTVHFIKVYNTSQEDGGWLGEVSTEVGAIGITTPVPGYKPKDYYVNYIASRRIQMLKGEVLKYDGLLFKNGIPTEEGTAIWTSNNTDVVTVDDNGIVNAHECGQTHIKFSQKSSTATDSIQIQVVELEKIFIQMVGNMSGGNDTLRLFVGEKEIVTVETKIKGSGSGGHNRFSYETFNYTLSNPEIGSISNNGLFKATKKGLSSLIVQSTHFPNLKDTIQVLVKGLPEIETVADTINLYHSSKNFKSTQLFKAGKKNATVFLDSLKVLGGKLFTNAKINGNIFEFELKENVIAYDSIKFYITAYGIKEEKKIVFKSIEPDNISSPKQILFVNGGEFGSTHSELMSYITEKDTTIKIDSYIGGATSVQDMLVDGNFAYVSADYYITRYNISKKQATDSVYTQDKTMQADGTGSDGAGVNHKMAIYQNMLLVTRQNSGSAPEDGYNVRVYNKGDLSLITKIPVSNQATDIIVDADKAYVMINGGFAGTASSMAIIDLKKLTLEEEVNLGTNGLGVMQMIHKNDKIYCIRLANSYGTAYKGGVIIYDIPTKTTEFINIPNTITYDSSPLAIEPMPNDSTLFIKKDLGYVVFNTNNNTFGTDVLFTSPNNNPAKGSVYDIKDKKYYVTYAGWSGNGVGQIYNDLGNNIGTFSGVGASPEVMKVSKQFAANTKPYIASGAPIASYKQNQYIKKYFNYYAYKDKEDGNTKPKYYIKNPAQYNWFYLEGRIIKGKYTEELSKDTTFNVPIQVFDKQGAFIVDTMKLTIKPEDYAPVVANPVQDIITEVGDDLTIDLSQVFEDPDNANTSISISAKSADTSLVTASTTGKLLALDILDILGETNITLTATSNGKTVTDKFLITIVPTDAAPTVVNPIADINVDENAIIAPINIASVFDDVDNDNNAIAKKILSNSNSTLLSSLIEGDEIKITLQPNQIGTAEIIVQATSNNKTITDAFTVTVNNVVDNAPTIANAIENITVDEDAIIEAIELKDVFDDTDNENTEIIKTLGSNSNTNLLDATITGDKLSIILKPNQSGEEIVVIKGSSNGKEVNDTVIVKVNAVDDAPSIVNAISDKNVDEDATVADIDLSSVFTDIDNEDKNIVKSIVSNTRPDLLSVKVDGNTLKTTLNSNQTGTAIITVKATSNGNMATDYFTIQVNPIDDAPIVANPINDIILNSNENIETIDISQVFTDIDNKDLLITKEILSNSSTELVSLNLVGNILNIDIQPNKLGEAEIVLKATSNGLTVNETFKIIKHDASPTVMNPIADITANEDETVATIDLSSVFNDIDNDNSTIVKTISNNSNESLLNASINENTLSIELIANQYGTADIVILATSNNLTITNTFRVTVNAVDDAPTVINPIADITADENGTVATIDLSSVFDDVDNDNPTIVKTISNNSNESLLNASINENTLSIELIANQYGTADIVVLATSNGKTITDMFTVTVTEDQAPTVANAINDVEVKENAEPTVISLANVFTDADDDDANITTSIKNNTNADLVTATISSNELTLTYTANTFGETEVTIEATSNGKTITDVFTVTVAEDQAPTVANAINDVEVKENAEPTVISLANVFTDADDDDANITTSIKNNTNVDLVTATISGNELTLTYTANTFGETEVTIEATSNGKTITDMFTVTVAEDQAPTVANAINDVEVKENAEPTVISLANVFTDADDDDANITTSIKNNTNVDLVTATISDNELTLTYTANTFGETEVTIEATSNGKTITDMFTVTVVKSGMSIENISNSNFTIYPNPSNGVFRIKGSKNKKTAINIYNVSGHLVYSNYNYINNTKIDMSSEPGHYIIKMIQGKYISVKTIIIK